MGFGKRKGYNLCVNRRKKHEKKKTANETFPASKLLGATHPPTNNSQVTSQIETAPLKSDAELLDFKATIKTDEAPDPVHKRPFINEQTERSDISFYFTETLHAPSKEDWKSAS